jgi:hypothetical protein
MWNVWTKKNLATQHLPTCRLHIQGDLIGRIFAQWLLVYVHTLDCFLNYRNSPNCWASFSTINDILTKRGLGKNLGKILKIHLATQFSFKIRVHLKNCMTANFVFLPLSTFRPFLASG